MGKDTEFDDMPVPAADVISYSDVDAQKGEFERSVALNERLLLKLQEYELMLLDAATLAAMLDVLLLSAREHFGISDIKLCLHDPQETIEELLAPDLDYGNSLLFVHDSFELQQLYGTSPKVEVLSADDPRSGQALPGVLDIESLILLPLIRDEQMVGSLHWGASHELFSTGAEQDFIAHLSAIIAICYENCVNAERLSQLSLLDPLTRLSNERAFVMELRKEISRAERSQKPLTLLTLKVDDFREINHNYGHLSGDFVLKIIADLLAGMLRHTDMVARCQADLFFVLLPQCAEVRGQDIAERMRTEAEFMEIDDKRGANLFASLSIGLTNWNPQSYPAVNMEQLAKQMRTACAQALDKALAKGGNGVAVTRLTTMIV